jgi:hypothetical protein
VKKSFRASWFSSKFTTHSPRASIFYFKIYCGAGNRADSVRWKSGEGAELWGRVSAHPDFHQNLRPTHQEHLYFILKFIVVQETELILFVEEVDKGRSCEEEFPRILIFIKIYDPLTKSIYILF